MTFRNCITVDFRSSLEPVLPPPPPPDFSDSDATELESRYGGRIISNAAAVIVQRAWRTHRLSKQFKQLLSLSSVNDRLAGVLRQEQESRNLTPPSLDIASIPTPELATFNSHADAQPSSLHRPPANTVSRPELKISEQQQYLRRTTSLRLERNKHKAIRAQRATPGGDDLSSIPPPCPPLKGTTTV